VILTFTGKVVEEDGTENFKEQESSNQERVKDPRLQSRSFSAY
jgi:hypothetical protein